jgi:hypothetical protein
MLSYRNVFKICGASKLNTIDFSVKKSGTEIYKLSVLGMLKFQREMTESVQLVVKYKKSY